MPVILAVGAQQRFEASMTKQIWTVYILLPFFCAHGFTAAPVRQSTKLHPPATADTDHSDRRGFLAAIAAITASFSMKYPAAAIDVSTIPMKSFVDPQGLFSISIPKSFFALRRSSKGDLPDEKTGEGRRGSSIFTAGDMSKAEIIAVERFPTRVMLEENGIQATGNLKSFPAIGEPSAIANLLNLRREKGKEGKSNSEILPDSLFISSDGKDLFFKVRSEIQVQKPELLMEQYGVSELFRVTTCKASLRANDGNILVVYASALERDYLGPDGAALQEAVNSFEATEQQPTTLLDIHGS